MVDGSYLAQLATADMRLPLQYAFTWPHRRPMRVAAAPLDLAAAGTLSFAALEPGRFPCFELAVAAGKAGGLAPAAMNAANEVAVERFLAGALPFGAIPEVIGATLAAASIGDGGGYDALAEMDAWARRRAADEAARLAPV
jgi:1-deoxy-D-xylulose-5-phosphate reductoisomerase